MATRGALGSEFLGLEWCISEEVNVLVMWGQGAGFTAVHHQ